MVELDPSRPRVRTSEPRKVVLEGSYRMRRGIYRQATLKEPDPTSSEPEAKQG
jgi:hypothetical protein